MIDGDLSEEIMKVWEGYDDFERGGLEYVAFLQRRNVAEMMEAETDEEIANELADQAIVAMRLLSEMGYVPEYEIEYRLHARMKGNQEDIIRSYMSEFNGYDR